MRLVVLFVLSLFALPVAAQERVAPADLPRVLIDRMAADPECRPFADLANGADIEVHRSFDGDKALFFLPCWSAAYNFGWKVFVEVFEDEYEQQAFAEYEPSVGWSATTWLVNYWYDPATRSVGMFNKSRGLGDCGTSGEWQWREYEFVLVRYDSQPTCSDGPVDEESGPGDFPTVYTEATGPALPAPPIGPAGEAAPPRPISDVPEALLAHHSASSSDECDAFEDLSNGDEAYIEELSRGTVLYLIPCVSGAYRFFHRAYLGEGDRFTPLWFATPTYAAGWQPAPGVWLDRFEPEGLRLVAADLGSSLGDCGITAAWRWDGTLFRMLEARMKADCDQQGEPGMFPLVFSAGRD